MDVDFYVEGILKPKYFALNVFVIILIGFSNSFSYAVESWNQIEIAASSGKTLNLVGIAEKRNLSDYSSPKRCAFVAHNKNGVSNTYLFQNQNYDFSANPAV